MSFSVNEYYLKCIMLEQSFRTVSKIKSEEPHSKKSLGRTLALTFLNRKFSSCKLFEGR